MISFDIISLAFINSLVSALICAALACYLFVHRRVAGAIQLMALMMAVGEWALTYAMEFNSPDLATKLFWVRLEYFGGAWTSFLLLFFVLHTTGREDWLTRSRLMGLAVFPVIVPFLAITNDWHRLMWRTAWLEGSGNALFVAYDRGPGFWAFVAVSYLMLVASSAVLVRAYLGARHLYRKQLGIILFGISAPWIGNALYLFELGPFQRIDLTPAAFTFSGLAFAWGVFRHQLLDILPVAREAVLDAMEDAVLVLDVNDRIVDLNPAALNLVAGRPLKSVLGRPLKSLPALFEPIDMCRSTGTTGRTEIELERETRRSILDLRVSPLFYKQGKAGGWLAVFQDITDRKRFEEALGESEEKFRSISANALDAVFMIDPDNRISFWNKAAEDIFGYPSETVQGLDVFSIMVPPEEHPSYRKAFSRFLEARKTPVSGRTVELVALHRDGRRLAVELSMSTIDLKGRRHAVGILRDITSRKAAETEKEKLRLQLQHAQKMEAIGTLAGGVAHDLNNILSGIVSYPDLILMQLPPDSQLRKPIATMQASGQKAAAMVQDLLTLARRGVSVSQVVDINTVVSDYLASPEHQALKQSHPGVQVHFRPEDNVHHIMGSPVHLSKAIMNLVANAAEAMPDGGALEVSTENRRVDRPIRGLDEIPPGDYAVLSVADSGTGISLQDQERIFEPFYTRKVMGRSGTGLGMSVVWGTVKDHQGHIALDTRVGDGTCFSLFFPATGKPLAPAPQAKPVDDYRGQGETILVVDDEPQQREIATEMLEALNYEVFAVSSGEAALEWVRGRRAALVVMDMIMGPGMDGLEACQGIRALCPGQAIIIASGYSETGRVLKAQRIGAGQYLRKPYTLEGLGLAVRQALDAAARPQPRPEPERR